jgi:hypothetical protein
VLRIAPKECTKAVFRIFGKETSPPVTFGQAFYSHPERSRRRAIKRHNARLNGTGGKSPVCLDFSLGLKRPDLNQSLMPKLLFFYTFLRFRLSQKARHKLYKHPFWPSD